MADEVVVSALCVGGPLDGKRVPARSDSFLAADRVAGKAWLYTRQPDGSFSVCPDHDPSLTYPQGTENGERNLDLARLWKAGEQSALDIIAIES